MKTILAEVSNLLNLAKAVEILSDPATLEPAMGLIYGKTGYGKTTAVQWMMNRTSSVGYRSVYVRAKSIWTMSAMLQDTAIALGLQPKHGNVKNLKMIIDHLLENYIALFFDEANYVSRDRKLLNAVRDIHDLTARPLVLVGTSGIEADLAKEEQTDRRVTQRIVFQPLTFSDVKIVSRTCCEVEVEDDLIAKLSDWSGGSIAYVTIGLAEIERNAKLEEVSIATEEWWNNRKFRREE